MIFRLESMAGGTQYPPPNLTFFHSLHHGFTAAYIPCTLFHYNYHHRVIWKQQPFQKCSTAYYCMVASSTGIFLKIFRKQGTNRVQFVEIGNLHLDQMNLLITTGSC